MRPKAATKFITMHRSDALNTTQQATGAPAWLVHLGEVAQWLVQLTGWLWLGQQGVQRGWDLAGGVLAVAIWWALRIACRGQTWVLRSSTRWLGGLGAATVIGVWMLEVSPTPMVDGRFAWTGLLVLAAAWGLWCAFVETRAKGSHLVVGHGAWHPLWAAALLGLVWALPAGGTALMLTLCALLLWRRDGESALRSHVCKSAQGAWPQLLAPSVMGLMMGTMWLGGDWCMGAGWTQPQMVAAHVALMAGGPSAVALMLGRLQTLRGTSIQVQAAHDRGCLALTALAAALWMVGGSVFGAIAMGLSSLAWALHCTRPRSRAVKPSSARLVRTLHMRRVAILLGPVLLVWVGLASAQLGPAALQWALALLGTLAALLLVVSGVQSAKSYLHHPAV
jgi:hypothetical protein